MKYQCDVIQDLLPLYQDGVCSEGSCNMVKEHLLECKDCKKMSEKLNDTTYEDKLSIEKGSIIQHHAKDVKRKTFIAGGSIAGLLMIPIIVCLICNIAIGHSLDWFFIVFTSLMVFASITVVPLMVEKKKFVWSFISFTISLFLLLIVCCIYTNGDWFFVAVFPILLGFSIVFLPIILYQIKLPVFLSNKKGLISMLLDTIFLYAVIIVSGIYAGGDNYWGIALPTTTVWALLPWIIFLVIRYLNINGFMKAGIIIILIGIFTAFANDIYSFIIGEPGYSSLRDANFSAWVGDNTINANILLIILLTSIILGVLLIILGVFRKYHRDL